VPALPRRAVAGVATDLVPAWDENEASCLGRMALPLSPTNGSRAPPGGGPHGVAIAFRPMMTLRLVGRSVCAPQVPIAACGEKQIAGSRQAGAAAPRPRGLCCAID
jgi:hypothetical protein